MKLIMKSLLIAFIAIILNVPVQAQKLFSGTIEYEITYSGAALDPAQAAMQPKSLIMTVSGKKSIIEMQQGGEKSIAIKNADSSTIVLLLNIMEKKYFVKITKDKIEKAFAEMPKAKITITEEKKDIAGMSATKAIVITTDEEGKETTEEVYFSSEIGGEGFNFNSPYRDIKGGLLQYSVNTDGVIQMFTAKEIKAKKIKDTAFMVSSDYVETTIEELQEIYGGQ